MYVRIDQMAKRVDLTAILNFKPILKFKKGFEEI